MLTFLVKNGKMKEVYILRRREKTSSQISYSLLGRPRPSRSSNLKVSNQKQITPNSGLYASAFNEYCYEDLH